MSRSERVSIQIPSAPQPAFDAETAVRERYQQAAQTFEPSLCCAVKYDGRWPAKFALCRNRPPPSLHFSTKRPAPFEFSGTVLETRSINALGKANRQWTDAAGDTSNSGYDKGGNRVSATDGKSETTTYVFDARGRQIKQVDRLAGETEFAYTDTGQLASLTDAENQVTSYTYDDAGRKASEAFTMGGQTYTTGLDYDAAGQLIEYTYPDGSVVARSYNDRGQLYQISFDSTVIDTRAYDDGGRMTSSTYNNGVGETRAYNVDNTLASITFSGASIGTYSYGWDDNKNKTSETITGTMSGYGFAVGSSGYDEEDRLLNWERTDSNLDQSWDLSLVGDWDSFTENSSTQNRTHGPTHELLTAGGQSLTHDTKGNMTLIPSGLRSNASSLALTWDFENKMKTADIGNNSSVDVTYKWDALGRRVYRDDGTSAFVYVQVGQQTIADYGWSVAPASPKYNYVYASYIDEPVMREEPSANERLFFHRSQQFSTVALTDGTGATVERCAYDAYGEPEFLNGTGTVIIDSAEDNRYAYTGREWDEDLALHHFRARMYDSEAGRFLGRDPMGFVDGYSFYAAYFAPSSKDPTGLTEFEDPFGGWCCHGEADDCFVGIGVRAPCRSVREQIADNLRLGRPAMDGVVTGHAWMFGECGTRWINIGVYTDPNANPLDGPIFPKDEAENYRRFGATHFLRMGVCPQTFGCVFGAIRNFLNSLQGEEPPRYYAIDLLNGGNVNCSTWVRDVFSECGYDFGRGILEPYDLAQLVGTVPESPCLQDQAGGNAN